MKHVHILGIGGVFMGSLALIARQLGYKVTGVDANLYPPMSNILKDNDIAYIESKTYENHLDNEEKKLLSEADFVIIGNVIKRSNPVIDYLLDNDMKFYSGAGWLYEFVLRKQWVIAVTGTHGKTTTTSLLIWILDYAGLEPGFLLGGSHSNFGVSGRLGAGNFFVIEADEYDTYLFDKRPKFLHYFPDTLVINNIEFDHADIYNNVEEIKKQFKFLLRTISTSYGKVIFNADDENVIEVLSENTNLEKIGFSLTENDSVNLNKLNNIYNTKIVSNREFIFKALKDHKIDSPLMGEHNVANTVSAISAAEHAGVPIEVAIESLKTFKGVSRRLEFKAQIGNIKIYDDFAHHPTAISKTLDTLKKEYPKSKIIAVVDFCSYSMRSGIHKDSLKGSLSMADKLFLYQGEYVKWVLKDYIQLDNKEQEVLIFETFDSLLNGLQEVLNNDAVIVFMSNGNFTEIIPKAIKQFNLKFIK